MKHGAGNETLSFNNEKIMGKKDDLRSGKNDYLIKVLGVKDSELGEHEKKRESCN